MKDKVYVLQKDTVRSTFSHDIVLKRGEEVTFNGYNYETKDGWGFSKCFVENNTFFFKLRESVKPIVSFIGLTIENNVSYDICYEGGLVIDNNSITKERLAEILIAESKNLLVISYNKSEIKYIKKDKRRIKEVLSLEDAIILAEKKGNKNGLEEFIDFLIYCFKKVNGFKDWFNLKYNNDDGFPIYVEIDNGIYIDLSKIRTAYSVLNCKR